jgi:hypothetical protein
LSANIGSPRPVGRNADSGPPYALYRRQLYPEGSSRSRYIYDKRLRPEAAYRKAIVSVDWWREAVVR